MNFLRKLAGMFTGGRSGGSSRQLQIYVLSRRCNEPIAGEVDLYNELSQAEDDSDHGYFTRKVLHTTGENRCFDQVEVNIWFDNNKNVSEYQVEGGRWLSEEEYQVELARFNAPPEDETQQDETQEEDVIGSKPDSGSPADTVSDGGTVQSGASSGEAPRNPGPSDPTPPDKRS